MNKTWTQKWRAQAQDAQKPLQFFVRNPQPCSLYDKQIAYVDPKCPCQPAHNTWAHIEEARYEKDHSITLWVSQPAIFRILFWWDENGIQLRDDGPRFDYVNSTATTGYSWDHLPEESGEYECTFVKRATILPLHKIASLEEVYSHFMTLDQLLAGKTITEIFPLTEIFLGYKRTTFTEQSEREQSGFSATNDSPLCINFTDGTFIMVDCNGQFFLMREDEKDVFRFVFNSEREKGTYDKI